MQIIIVSRHLKSARTLTIMPRHVVGVLALFVALVIATSTLFSWLSVQFRLPLVEDLLLSVQQRETKQTRDYISNNLNLMATRLGELQGRLLQLDNLGDRVSDLAGIKQKPVAQPAEKPAEGGPYIPAPMSASELQQEIDRLAVEVDRQTDDLSYMEFRLLEKRVENRLLPTTLPVRGGRLGSGFGFRTDPFVGTRARHDGLDFAADVGTPVLAAADGVVLSAGFHPEFGNLIEVDHGEGLMSRYAHLSAMKVQPGMLVKRGEALGAVGSTGRSTGPHLHFEVRMLGVAQNPATFLKRSSEFAQLQRR